MADATITGKITIPGTEIGIRAKVEFHPMVKDERLTFDDRITLGPATGETGDDGIIQGGGIKVPIVPGVGWRLYVLPVANRDLSKKMNFGIYEVTASTTVQALVPTEEEGWTPALFQQVTEKAAQVETNAEQVAADRAAVEAVGTTNDGIMTTVAADPGSAFSQQLSADFVAQPTEAPDDGEALVWDAATAEWKPGPAGNPGLEGRVTDLEAAVSDIQVSVPTLEEAHANVILSAGSISASTTQPFHVALFPSQLDQVSLIVRTAVAESDTNYWTVELRRRRGGAITTIATKTTKTNVSGGQGMAAWTDWNFDASAQQIGKYLKKGDVLVLVLTPTGTPTALDGPILTFRTTPNDGALAAYVVADDFTRADSASSLGVAPTGHAWTALAGTWGISGNQAYLVSAAGAPSARAHAVVDAGVADCAVSIKLAANPAGAAFPGLDFRASDNLNLFTTDRVGLYRYDAGTGTTLLTWPALSTGDTITVQGAGATITVYKNGSTVLGSVSDTKNQTVTKHGLRVTGGTGFEGYRLDEFRIAA